MHQSPLVPKGLWLFVFLFNSSKQFNMVIVACRVAVLMLKWEPHVHSLEKEIRAQIAVLKFL